MLHKYVYCLNNPVIFVDQWGNFTWLGWSGGILFGAGSVMVLSGVGGSFGVVVLGVGGVLIMADWVISVGYDAPKTGRETGEAILLKMIENSGGLTAKELQEMGRIPSTETLRKLGYDLQKLGLK